MPVTRFEAYFDRPFAGGRSFGASGPYRETRGRLHFEVIPGHPANERITDLKLAPLNAAGRVEFSADLSVIAPEDPERGNRGLVLDVVNRGNRVVLSNFNRAPRQPIGPDDDPRGEVDPGDGFLMRLGYTVVACGWQKDLPPYPALLRLYGPDAFGPDGRPITGRVFTQLQSHEPVENFLLSDRMHAPYTAADLDEQAASMVVRDEPDGEPHHVPRSSWRFGRTENGRYVPDPAYVTMHGGFEKGRLYQVVYTTLGARILGLSFAALRDCASWMKHGAPGSPPPASRAPVLHAYAYGRSQTGRWLRTFVYNDLNLDEDGRESFDGIIANVAGGMRGEFNQRFGQNSKDRINMMAHLFPFASSPQTDTETEQTGSLHARLDARHSPLKVFYTNSSAEYHRGDASLLHTDPAGILDLDPGPNVRIYHFAGTEHGLGWWPPSDTAPENPDRAQNLRGVIDYNPLLRAALANLHRWVSGGIKPPASRHPRLDDGTAVSPESLKPVFDRIPGASYPRHHAKPVRVDFGLSRETEQTHTLPPVRGKAYGSLVSAVDTDGNEVAGIALPEVAVPLAAHTGWTLRHPSVGGETQLLMFGGATIPFARDRAERLATGDPRPSIAERYPSRNDYLARVRAAGEQLASEGYILKEDIEASLVQAAKFWNHFA